MSILLGQVVPDFEADTQVGKIKFHDFIGDKWVLFCSHPADYTPVCTTELGKLANLEPEFQKRNVKIIAISCDDVKSHKGWIADVNAYSNADLQYPIIADNERKVARLFGMIPAGDGPTDANGLPMTVRSVFVIGPDKKLKLSLTYPASTGRNFDEILRVIDSLQLTSDKSLATPVDWQQGEPCVILPTVSTEDAKASFPEGWKTVDLPSHRPYLRLTPQPTL